MVRERAATDRRLALVNGSGRLNAAQACNLGIQQGRSELIARVDAHTYLYPDYLRRAAELLVEEGPDGVLRRRPARAGGGDPVRRGGGAGPRLELRRGQRACTPTSSTRAEVDTIQAGVYRRAPLEEVGGFRTDMLVGEDEELNWRLKKAGYRLVLDTSVRFVYTTRSSWGAVFRQHRNYGQSRVRVLAAHPDFLRAVPPGPAGPGASPLGGLALAGPVSRRRAAGLLGLRLAYGAGATAASVSASRSRPELIPRLCGLLPGAAPRLRRGDDRGSRAEAARPRSGWGEPRTAVRAALRWAT